jgi:hypothetical protein
MKKDMMSTHEKVTGKKVTSDMMKRHSESVKKSKKNMKAREKKMSL